MRRKVIQIAESTHLVSLPHRWVKDYNIKKGEELEVTAVKGQLIISREAPIISEKVEVDVTGLDRTSIIILLRGLYKRGFEEIKVICNAPVISHFRIGEKINFLSVVHSEVNRLPGVEVFEQKGNYCVIKAISEPTLREWETIMRRLLLLVIDAGRDVINSAKVYDESLLKTIEEKHDTVHKFTSYTMRMLNKSQGTDQMFKFAMVALVDKVMDYVKNTSRLIIRYQKKLRPESIHLMEEMLNTFILFQQIYFKIDYQLINQISREKEEIHASLINLSRKLPKEEAFILDTLESSLEVYRGMVEMRLALL